MANVTALIVITNAVKPQANTIARELDPTIPAGADSFSAGLSLSGLEPATHWFCSWEMTPEEWQQAQNRLGNNSNVPVLADATGWTLTQKIAHILAQTGLKRVTRPM